MLAALAQAAGAAPAPAACRRVSVLAVTRLTETQSVVLSEPSALIFGGTRLAPGASGSSSRSAQFTLLGPILGSMDARDVDTTISCTPAGLRLVATTTRSAAFGGATEKNILWRPLIVLSLRLRAAASIVSEWRICLSTGSVLHCAATPPYPAHPYPIVRITRVDSGEGNPGR